ncbi:hypothetical protein AB0M80_30890 [Amycolatopsis sp. NPDC051045]|uniref:hypothetical protein n=1 Tax=Amycolatopsis sp. NPDC051045 TaxID=3156922 RepID=UPI003432C33E
MSSIIEFFVAPDDTAAAGVMERGPGGSFESATYGHFDIWSTLVEWESILRSRRLAEPMTSGGPEDEIDPDFVSLVDNVRSSTDRVKRRPKPVDVSGWCADGQ